MTLLLIGATGNVGLPLLQALRGREGIRALVTGEAQAARVRDNDIEPVLGDLSQPESLAGAFAGAERIFLLTPFVAGQEGWEHAALDAAEKAGVQHVVKLAYAGLDWPITITDSHRKIVDRLAASPFETTLLLADVYASNVLGQAALLRAGQLVLPGPTARIAYVDPGDVGEVAAALLTSTDPALGHVVVTGPELLDNVHVADIAGRAYTGTPAEYVPVDPEPFTASLVQGGWPEFIAGAVAQMHVTIAEQGPLPVTDTVRTHLGRDATPLQAFLQNALAHGG